MITQGSKPVPRIKQVSEPTHVQTFFSILAIEAFDLSSPHRLFAREVNQLNLALV
jgi:hypothetical protein